MSLRKIENPKTVYFFSSRLNIYFFGYNNIILLELKYLFLINREFFYIQMEKYARQHLAEGIQNAEDLHVDVDSEIYRTLNSHYNRNNQLEVCFLIMSSFELKLWFNNNF